MNETLNIVSTATTLPNKQFIQLLGAFDSHQTFSQKVNKFDYIEEKNMKFIVILFFIPGHS